MKSGQLSFFVDEQASSLILLSLREEYYKEIISGKKNFEYRKRFVKHSSTAFVYISKTRKEIVSVIEFGEPIIGDSEMIADIAENDCPGSRSDILEYLAGGKGYAIPIVAVFEIEEISLSFLRENFENFVVPQSYYILNKKKELADFLLNRRKARTIRINKQGESDGDTKIF